MLGTVLHAEDTEEGKMDSVCSRTLELSGAQGQARDPTQSVRCHAEGSLRCSKSTKEGM